MIHIGIISENTPRWTLRSRSPFLRHGLLQHSACTTPETHFSNMYIETASDWFPCNILKQLMQNFLSDKKVFPLLTEVWFAAF